MLLFGNEQSQLCLTGVFWTEPQFFNPPLDGEGALLASGDGGDQSYF